MANASDRKQIEAANRREKGARMAELADVKHVMSEPRGRAVVARLLERTGTDAPTPFSSNAMTLARDVGVKSVGEWLLLEVRAACPEQELVMRREAAILADRIARQDEVKDGHEHSN